MPRIAPRPVHAPAHLANRETESIHIDRNPLYPYRRSMDWRSDAGPVSIRSQLSELSITAGRPSWGQVFRYGLVVIPEADFHRIGAAMLAGEHLAVSASGQSSHHIRKRKKTVRDVSYSFPSIVRRWAGGAMD